MTGKEILERIKAELKRQKAQWRLCHSSEAKYRCEMLNDISAFVDCVDSIQKKSVLVWHDKNEIPKQGANILMIRKEEKDSNYPPIAGCFHGTNSRYDGKNWGYYNGFCYNEIEAPYKWAYIDDILKLLN